MSLSLSGSPYTPSQADSTGQPTVNWPGGIGTLDAGKIPLTGGQRRRPNGRRPNGRMSRRGRSRRGRGRRTRRRCW